MSILLKTMVDATPLLLGILAIMAVVNLIVFVGTYDSRPKRVHNKRLTMDMVRDTRYMNLE